MRGVGRDIPVRSLASAQPRPSDLRPGFSCASTFGKFLQTEQFSRPAGGVRASARYLTDAASVAPAISGLPGDIVQSRKQVFEFAFVRALGSVDCFANHAVQAIQLIACEFNEVTFHRARSPS